MGYAYDVRVNMCYIQFILEVVMKRKEFTSLDLINIPRLDSILEHGLFAFMGIKYTKKNSLVARHTHW